MRKNLQLWRLSTTVWGISLDSKNCVKLTSRILQTTTIYPYSVYSYFIIRAHFKNDFNLLIIRRYVYYCIFIQRSTRISNAKYNAGKYTVWPRYCYSRYLKWKVVYQAKRLIDIDWFLPNNLQKSQVNILSSIWDRRAINTWQADKNMKLEISTAIKCPLQLVFLLPWYRDDTNKTWEEQKKQCNIKRRSRGWTLRD